MHAILLKVSELLDPTPLPNTSVLLAFTVKYKLPDHINAFIETTTKWTTIITSQQALHALDSFALLNRFVDKDLFVVGQASYSLAKSLGFRHIYGECTHTAQELVHYMQDLVIDCRSFVFLSGDKRRDIVPNAFIGKHFIEFEVYETIPKPDIQSQLEALFTKHALPNDTLWVVFFSPSIVKLVYPIVNALISTHTFKYASIGPTTTSSLLDVGCTPHVESPEPCISKLMESIDKYTFIQ